VVFRTTLMNAYTLHRVRRGMDYVDLFLRELPACLRRAKEASDKA